MFIMYQNMHTVPVYSSPHTHTHTHTHTKPGITYAATFIKILF